MSCRRVFHEFLQEVLVGLWVILGGGTPTGDFAVMY